MSKKPNIVFVFSDQHNAFVDLGELGIAPRTPHLDRLKNSGAHFPNAYCNSPICAPSRVSMMSARLPSEVGAFENDDRLSPLDPTFVHGLNAAGYATALCGKMHFLEPDFYHGFQENLLGEPEAELFNHLKLTSPYARRWNETGPNPLVFSGYGRQGYQFFDRAVAETSVRYIQEHTQTSRPYFLLAGFILPHNPFVCEESRFHYYYARIDRKQLAKRIGIISAHEPYLRIFRAVNQIEDIPLEAHHRALAGYFGLCEEMDENLGLILSAVENSGEAAETIVIYSSDHGEICGKSGLWYKSSLTEDSVRVPLLIAGPGIPAGVRNRVVGLTDLAVTINALAGAVPPPQASGVSFASALFDCSDAEDGRVICESSGRAGAGPLWMMREGDWKYVYCHEPPLEILTHLVSDPNEEKNLIDQSDHQEIVSRFRELRTSTWDADQVRRQWKKRNQDRDYLKSGQGLAVPQPPSNLSVSSEWNRFPQDQLPEAIRTWLEQSAI